MHPVRGLFQQGPLPRLRIPTPPTDARSTMPGAAERAAILDGDLAQLNRLLLFPCVDCGQMTGETCDLCLAADRDPRLPREYNQGTPLCTRCKHMRRGLCHFCRGQHWCAPLSKGSKLLPENQ